MRVGIIGAGPSGFYVAERLLKLMPDVNISLIEARFCPFGLIRYGVAPDHPEIKMCEKHFSEIGRHSQLSFYGGLRVGVHLPLCLVQKTHDAVVICTGIELPRKLDIPGINGKNIFDSRQFTGWYNSHPDFNLPDIKLSNVKDVVIVGNGNVALDVARILGKKPALLRHTDISVKAYEGLLASKIQTIHICARRGPLNTSFSVKEFREMADLDFSLRFDRKVLDLCTASLAQESRRIQRLVPLMMKYAEEYGSRSAAQTCYFDFFHKPQRINLNKEGLADSLSFEVGHTERKDIRADLVITCIGYAQDNQLPFSRNADGSIKNHQGRVGEGSSPTYVAGWAASGAHGALAATMAQSHLTAEQLAADFHGFKSPLDTLAFSDALKRAKIRYLSFMDWERLNEIELTLGKGLQKARLKVESADAARQLLEK